MLMNFQSLVSIKVDINFKNVFGMRIIPKSLPVFMINRNRYCGCRLEIMVFNRAVAWYYYLADTIVNIKDYRLGL